MPWGLCFDERSTDWTAVRVAARTSTTERNARRIKAFAARHKWSATLEGAGVASDREINKA